MAALSLFVSILTGFLLVRTLWPGSTRWEPTDWFRLPLGVWCGLGLSSITSFAISSFAAQVSNPGDRAVWMLGDSALLALAAVGWAMFGRRSAEPLVEDEAAAWPASKWFALASAAVMPVAFFLMAVPRQTGEVDAWSIWNMKARFLYRGGTFATLADPLLSWTHPEFPYLLPALVLRSWHWAGEESMTAPMLLATLFVASLAMAMFGAVRLLRSNSQAFLALTALLGSAGFIGSGAVQYADFPLAAFLFGGVASIAVAERAGLRGLAVIAGLCAGFAAWTKFEGIFYAAALLGFAVWRLGSGSAITMILGAIPGVAMLAYFRLSIAPAVSAISADPVMLLLAIVAKMATFQFLGWVVSPFLVFALYLYCVGVSKTRRHGWIALAGLFVAGCLAIIVRDDNIGDAAAIRILLHLWPVALLAAFLHANSPEELTVVSKGKTPKTAGSRK